MLALQPQREFHLLQLARHGALLGQEQVLRELLRQRRAALRDAAMQHVGDRGARDADRIDAVMRIEAAVLDGDEGLRQIGRQILQRRHWRRPFRRACASTLPSRPTIWMVGGRFGISSDWIAGRCAPTQITTPIDGDRRPQAEHRAPIEQPSDAGTAAARFRPALGAALGSRAPCARAAARRHHRRICVWRMISSACRRHGRRGPAGRGAIRPARRRARIAAPCVRRSFSVPTPYANAAHTRPAAR